MFKKADPTFNMSLCNAEGVPVLYLYGTVTSTALERVASALEHLIRAGHYNVVLNIERAQAADWKFLGSLAGAVNGIRNHYGAVKIVASQEKIQQLLRIDQLAQLFKLCRSERQAISQIKRLARQPEIISTTKARIVE